MSFSPLLFFQYSEHHAPLAYSQYQYHTSRLSQLKQHNPALAKQLVSIPIAKTRRELEETLVDEKHENDAVALQSIQSKSSASTSFGSQANQHFKYNFLSAGSVQANRRDLRVNRRPGIMDATRTFDSSDTKDSTQSKQKHIFDAIQESDRRIAAGLGYGSKHGHHYRYLSRSRSSLSHPPPSSPFTMDRGKKHVQISFDDLNHIRILDAEHFKQTETLAEECTAFVESNNINTTQTKEKKQAIIEKREYMR